MQVTTCEPVNPASATHAPHPKPATPRAGSGLRPEVLNPMTSKPSRSGRRKPPRRPRRPRLAPSTWILCQATRLLPVLITVAAVLASALAFSETAAYAADNGVVTLAADSIDGVISNIRVWLMGILAGWATLCLTVGFLRYTSGEPGEVERGKVAFRSAAIGYAGALLAPLIVTIVAGWVA